MAIIVKNYIIFDLFKEKVNSMKKKSLQSLVQYLFICTTRKFIRIQLVENYFSYIVRLLNLAKIFEKSVL